MSAITVVAIAVMSLDGCITRHDEEGTAFASAADQQFFRKALKSFDCCIFGAKTFESSQTEILQHRTPERLRIVLTRSPERYAALYHADHLEFTNAPPEAILADLRRRGKQRCAILGGSDIYTLFCEQRLVHELWLTIEPCLLGVGKRLIDGRIDASLRLISHELLAEDTLLLKYRFRY